MSAVPMEPNRRPSPPTRAVMDTGDDTIFLATSWGGGRGGGGGFSSGGGGDFGGGGASGSW